MNEDKYAYVKDLLFKHKYKLHFTEEDEKKLLKLWDAYWKKRRGTSRSDPVVLVASILWVYSSSNLLWEHDKNWAQKSLAELFSLRQKTIGNTASEIKKLLKIEFCDDRFCRKEIAEENPLKQMVMLESGFILPRENATEKGLPFTPLEETKED
ncbi:hypothetical protein HY772_00880 [Candidatus Woesearchaeota archaeon]|nr:hypothetical protein [Candidatus Woesearchaeota archaeon]